MTDLLTTFPKIDAVFAINDLSGVGAELAANQAQRKDFFIVGVDGAPEAIKAIAAKDSIGYSPHPRVPLISPTPHSLLPSFKSTDIRL